MTAIRSLAFALALAFLLSPQARAQDKAGGLKIGIVDLGVVFNEYGKKRQLEVDIQKQKNLYDEEIRKQTNMIRKLNEDLEELKGDKYEELAERLQLEIARRDIMKKRYEKKIRDQLIDMTLKLLEEINATVAKYGRENGYALILKVDDQGFGAKEEFREKIFRAQVQSVLYFDKTIDLTEVVLKDLNKNFKPEEAGK